MGTSEHEPAPGGAKLDAGALCLDFANTAEWHASANPEERLRAYGDFVAWSRRAELLTDPQAARLLREARRRPAAAAAALRQVLLVRELIYRIFGAIAGDRLPTRQDLEALNDSLPDALGRLRLARVGGGFAWGWAEEPRDLDWMLAPIVRSAADLLTSMDLARVRQCADDRGCGWLFLDRSKNRTRRWCDMGDCGNRAKARRHREKRTMDHRPQTTDHRPQTTDHGP